MTPATVSDALRAADVQAALSTIQNVSDRIEAYVLGDEMAPPYQLSTWRELLMDAERRLEKVA